LIFFFRAFSLSPSFFYRKKKREILNRVLLYILYSSSKKRNDQQKEEKRKKRKRGGVSPKKMKICKKRKGKKKKKEKLFFHPPTGVGSALTVEIPTRTPAADALIPPAFLLGSGALATCPTATLPAPCPAAALAALVAAPAAAPRPAPVPTAISAPVAESGTTLNARRGASAAMPAFTDPLGDAALGSLSWTVACSEDEDDEEEPPTLGAVIAMPSPLSLSVVESGAPGLTCSPSAFSLSALTPDDAAAALSIAAAAAAWPGSTTPPPVVARLRPSAPRWTPGAVMPSGPTWRLAAGPEKGPKGEEREEEEPSPAPGVRVVMEETVGMRASVVERRN